MYPSNIDESISIKEKEEFDDKALTAAEIRANELLGEVKGDELFQSLAKKALIPIQKR